VRTGIVETRQSLLQACFWYAVNHLANCSYASIYYTLHKKGSAKNAMPLFYISDAYLVTAIYYDKDKSFHTRIISNKKPGCIAATGFFFLVYCNYEMHSL
jgi:hypothetical protein